MIVLPVQEIRRRGMSEMKESWANGQVTFADTVEIVVEAAHPAALKNGTYTFLEATALKNVPAHLSDWTVVLPEGVKPAVRLHADGGRLSLDLVPQGTVVLFR